MYKVFLVEDEIIVREGIRDNIPWDETPYVLAGEAPDGEIALSMIQDIKPDILITDIRMPFMDGLALSRAVKKTMPWIKIIILSGHDEFEYAREAISAGVEEYLLKPVSSQEMLKTLDKMAGRIDEEKEKLLSLENLKAQVRSSADILREQFLSDFVNGRIPPQHAIEKSAEYNIDPAAHSYMTAVIEILPGEEARPGPLKKILETIMEQYAGSVWFTEHEKRFVLIIKAENGTEKTSSLEDTVYSIVRAFKYEAERNTGCKLMAGIGGQTGKIGEVPQSYKTALEITGYGVSRGLSQISDSGLLPPVKIPPTELQGNTFPDINGDMFLTRLRYAGKKDIDALINEYAKFPGKNYDEMTAYFVFGEIIMAASKIAEELETDIKTIAPFSLDTGKIKSLVVTQEIFAGKIRELLTAVIEYRDSHTTGRYQAVIVKAKEYIRKNFASGDISLFSTASWVGISPNHLSTVFAQETGENFIEYLTRIRLDRAKQLLKTTTMKSADIANETGFNDPHYFSHIFKKNTGLSPREFRLANS